MNPKGIFSRLRNIFIPALLFFSHALQAQQQLNTYETIRSSDWEYTYWSNDPLKTRFYKLQNGLTVITSVNKTAPRIQTMVAVKTGSKNDPADNTGLAHYLEHMLFKGTDKYGTQDWQKEQVFLDQIDLLYDAYNQSRDSVKRKQIYRAIDSVSALAAEYAVANEYDKMCQSIGATGTNAFTSFEQTVYINDIPANALHQWVSLEAERFRNPVLRLFHTELEAVYEEKNISLDDDMDQAWEMMMAGLFRNHNYGLQTTIGTVEHLKNPSLKAIRAYYRKYYVPNNMAIILVGDFDPDEAVSMIDGHFTDMQPATVPNYTYKPEPPRAAPDVRELFGPEAEQVMIGFRTPGAGTKEAAIARLVDLILNNAAAGLIDLNLVKQQKVLSANSMSESLKDYGLFLLTGRPRDGQTLEQVRDLLLEQVKLVQQGSFDPELLRAIILNEEISEINNLKDNQGRAMMLMSAFTSGLRYDVSRNELYTMSRLSKEEIMDFAKEYLGHDHVEVFKRIGTPANSAKIQKPEINQVALNRDKQSAWTAEWLREKSDSLKPVFVDFDKDITKSNNKNVPVWYVKNNDNRLFNLYYVLDIGQLHLRELPFALNYFKFLGTTGMNNEALSKKFYSLGCSYNISSGEKQSYITLSGPEEHFDEALALFEDLINNPLADKEALKSLVQRSIRQREDSRLDKGTISRALGSYARYGKDNPFRYTLSNQELKALKPEQLIHTIKSLSAYPHKVYYFGQRELPSLVQTLDKLHRIPAKRIPVPSAKQFAERPQNGNKVFFTHFDMVQADIRWQRQAGAYDMNMEPSINLFNEYFGGGMGSVVFQSIRESKALAYSTYSYFATPNEPNKNNQILAFVGTQADKLHEAIAAMQELLDSLPMDEAMLGLAKASIKKKVESERVVEDQVLFQYDEALRMGYREDIRSKVYLECGNISPAEILRFHKNYLSGKSYNISVVGSKNRIKTKELERYGPVEVVPLETLFPY
ncbi:MAG: insulinase family protein [Bacteroidetes bacterium]|nr:insulinase family protein [Bacteroidota bacterium]